MLGIINPFYIVNIKILLQNPRKFIFFLSFLHCMH